MADNKLLWDINKLSFYSENPKGIREDKYRELKESLQKNGQLNPLLVDVRDGKNFQILGGNSTLKALKEMGETSVWVEPKIPDSDAHAFELSIKHNMQYGYYMADPLGEIALKYKDELNLEKLEVDLGNYIALNELGVFLDEKIDRVNQEDEWVGLPEFEAKETSFKLIIHFDTKEECEQFVMDKDIKIKTKYEKIWSTWFPYKEDEDVKSLKYET
jgi:hypothetical protein